MIGKPIAAPVSRGFLSDAIGFAHLFGIAKKAPAARRSAAPPTKPIGVGPRSSSDRNDKLGSPYTADAEDRAAARRERQRCAAIFLSPAAGIRPDMAAHLAFNTDMTRGEAIRTLRKIAAGSSPTALRSLYASMAQRDALSPKGLALQCLRAAGLTPRK